MEEEEKKVNWSSPESGYTKEINYESIIDETQNLPFGVVPLTYQDGTTTYWYKGNEYTNPNEIPAFIKGTKVSRYDWIDKAGEFVGNVIQSSPTLRTVLPPVAKGLSLLEMPGETNFATMVGDSAENWGIDRRIGETAAYLVYPGLGELKPTSKFLSQLDDILVNPSYSKFNKDWVNNRMLMSKSDEAQGISKKGFDPNITKKNLELFDEIGFTGTNKLDIQDMLYGIDETGKPLMSQYKRRVLKAGIGDETFNWGAFTKNRDAVVKDFLDGLQDLKIDPKTIHGHHISALRITSSLFDGLSPIQRKKLIKIFQREGLQLGNHPDNLLALHKSTHLDVVHPFLEKQIGKYGQLLIDPAKIKKMTPKQREGLVQEFAKIIKRSEEIAMENTQKWLDDAWEGYSPEAAFDARMDILNKAFDDDIAFREQLLKSVKSEESLLPYQWEDVEIPDTPKPKKKRVTSKATKFKNLLKRIKTENPSWKQMTIWDIDDDALDAYREFSKYDR